MHLLRVHRTFPRLKQLLTRSQSSQVALNQDEYTDTPEYPPILDMSLQGKKLRERQAVHQKIQNLNTVEEKQIALNMPRFYGWRCIMLREDKVPYNVLPLVQCYTRTHLVHVDKLPEPYAETEAMAAETVKEVKGLIEDAIAIELEGVERTITTRLDKPEVSQIEDEVAKRVARQINRVITNNLADKAPHILAAQLDDNPRHEAFWQVGGIDCPSAVKGWRAQYPWLWKNISEPINRPVQYLGSPFLALRSHQPLRPLVPYTEATNPSFAVPKFTHEPAAMGYFVEHRHGTNVAGFWPGDIDEFGLLSIHGRGHILARKESFGPEDNLEALHCQALMSSFGWLLAQASYQGFTTYNDLTYPLVTQTLITNGNLWSLYAYQLNTVTMHDEQMDENPKHNICYGLKPQKLYDCIENGQVKGLNENLLKMIIQLYLNTPEKRDHEMKPYLGKDEQVIADIEDDNKRCWLEERYKHLVSNRAKHYLLPEVYLWEKIYKIKYNTRFQEAKRRPFELGINPYKRRLDEHLPPYIPKVLRPYPRSKKKFETTYYPDV